MNGLSESEIIRLKVLLHEQEVMQKTARAAERSQFVRNVNEIAEANGDTWYDVIESMGLKIVSAQ